MTRTPRERYVAWKDLGEGAGHWRVVYVDAGHEPDRISALADEQSKGRWSYRSMRDREVVEMFGRPPQGRFFLMVAFEEPDDAERFKAILGKPAGNA